MRPVRSRARAPRMRKNCSGGEGRLQNSKRAAALCRLARALIITQPFALPFPATPRRPRQELLHSPHAGAAAAAEKRGRRGGEFWVARWWWVLPSWGKTKSIGRGVRTHSTARTDAQERRPRWGKKGRNGCCGGGGGATGADGVGVQGHTPAGHTVRARRRPGTDESREQKKTKMLWGK